MRVLLLLVCGVVAGAVAKPSLYHDYVPAVYSAYYPYTSSQYHAQDELGQYSYGYTGDTSAKHETKTLDGVTRGGYSYVDANGVVQTVNYVADDVFGFRVAATNLPQDSGSVVAAAAPYVAPQQVAAAAPYVVPQPAAAPYVVPQQVAAAAPYVVPQQVVDTHTAPIVVSAAAPYVVPSQPVFEDSPAVTAAKVVHHANLEAATVHAAAAQAAAVGAPLPIADTPEVQRAKAEHIAAVQRAAAEAAANPDTGLVTVAAAAAPLAPVVAAPAYYGAPLGGVAYAYGTGYPLAARTYSYIPAAATSYSALTPLSSQYHAQDELGQYSYGYSGDTSTKHETKTLDGVTRGSYSYVDANGVVQTVNYVADDVFGFRVAATNLPLGPGAH